MITWDLVHSTQPLTFSWYLKDTTYINLHETIQFLFSLWVLNIFIGKNTKSIHNAKYLLEYFVLFYHYLVTWIKVTVLDCQGMAADWGTIHVKRLPSCDNVLYVLLVKLDLIPFRNQLIIVLKRNKTWLYFGVF